VPCLSKPLSLNQLLSQIQMVLGQEGQPELWVGGALTTARTPWNSDSIRGYMEANYLNRFGVVCGSDHRTLPEAELWTQVILRAIDDLDRRTALTSSSAQDSAREWFASECGRVGSFNWTCHVINVDPNFIRSQLAKKHRMKKPEEVVMTSIAQGVKISRGKDSHLRDNVDRAQGRPRFKRLLVQLWRDIRQTERFTASAFHFIDSYVIVDKDGVIRYLNIRPTNTEKDLLSTEDLLTAVKKVNKGS
jgi:hypothetical protein